MTFDASELLRDALRILSLGAIPVLGAGVAAGVVGGIVRWFTGIQDWSVSYALRLLALVLALVASAPYCIAELLQFAHRAFLL